MLYPVIFGNYYAGVCNRPNNNNTNLVTMQNLFYTDFNSFIYRWNIFLT